MSFDEQLYEQKYKSDPGEAKRYLQACIDGVREEAKNSSNHVAAASERRNSEFDIAKYSGMWARSPMLAADYLNRYIDLLRRKAAVVDAKVNLEDSMTATTGFAIPAASAPKHASELATEKFAAQKPDEPKGGWQKLKRSLSGIFGK